MSALVAIEHFTDPTCPWAFSAEPQRWRLRWLYGDQLAWTDRMVVLSERRRGASRRSFPPQLRASAMAMIQQRFGMPHRHERAPAQCGVGAPRAPRSSRRG